MKTALVTAVAIGVAVVGWIVWLGFAAPQSTALPAVSTVARQGDARTPAFAPVDSVIGDAIPLVGDRLRDSDGLTIAAFISTMAPRARQGDVDAALRVYRVERRCVRVDRLATLLDQVDDDMRQRLQTSLAAGRLACAGVTPAQVRERMGFLDQAIRAGSPDAMLWYRHEGPDGFEPASLAADDPRLGPWKQQAHAYLETLAATGERRAWSQLMADDASGATGPRDAAAAITYAVATLADLPLDIDPHAYAIVQELGQELSTAELEAAIERGRTLAARFPASREHRP